MRTGTAGFIPERLTEIRWARRIPSMTALARLLSISPSTVSRWEDEGGDYAPDPEVLADLANKLGVRQEYFLRPVFCDERPMFLRSLASTHVRDLDYQRAQMRWLQEVSSVVQHYVDLPSVDIPDVLAGASYHQLRNQDIEKIALDLRQHWGVGEGPCTDVVGLMERVGFVIGVIEMGTIKLDGLCSWSPEDRRPHVLLASDKMSFFRRQFDAAHEMAHGILHREVPQEEFKKNLSLIESQAFRLASSFLLPSTTYPFEARVPSLASLLTLKERWHVSIKAQIRRLKELEVIPEEAATHLYKMYSAKGWSRAEPLDNQWKAVEPRVLKDALHLIVDEGVRSKADLLGVEFTVSAGDIENLTGLPNGWFSHEAADIIKLKPGARSVEPFTERGGDVVPFPTKTR